MADGWDDFASQKVNESAAANVAATAGVPPQAAVDAIHNAPASGVPASVAMHAPTEPNDMALFHDHTAILNTSPPLASFVGSDPAKAAAVKDDFSSLAGVGRTLDKWNSIANQDFFAPGAAAGRALATDLQRWYKDSSKAQSPLDLIPGFSSKDRKLGSVLWDLAGVATSPVAGALNMAARPFSYIPEQTVGTTPQQLTQPEAQAKWVDTFGKALMGLGPKIDLGVAPEAAAGRLALPAPDTSPTGGPMPPVEPLAPPGIRPEDTPSYSAIAEMDAHGVSQIQDSLTETKTLTRSSTLIQDFMNNHAGLAGQEVAVPAEAISSLWNQGHEAFADYHAEVQDALKTGADVRMPLADYLAQTAGKSFAEELNAATIFREGGVSVEGAKGLPEPVDEQAAVAPSIAPNIPADIEPEFYEPIQALAARADIAVDQVFKENALDTLFAEPKAMEMNKGLFERYGDAVEAARSEIHDRLLQKAYTQIRRERTPEFKAAVQLHTEQALKDLAVQPNIITMRALADSSFKIDRAAVPEELRLPNSILKHGGLSPDEAAELAGYPSGKDLLVDMHNLQVAIEANGGTLSSYIKNRAKIYGHEQARQMTGYDVSPEALLAAAREAVASPKIEELLIDGLKEVGQRVGFPIDRQAIQAEAARTFGELKTADAARSRTFASNMKRLGDKAEKSILSGKDIEAFKYKQQQLIQFLHLKQSFNFQKELARGVRQLTKIARKPIVPGMDQAARNHLRWIAREVGIKVSEGKYEGLDESLKGQSLEAYVNSLRNRGFEPVFASIPRLEIPAMTVEQFRGVAETVKSIAQLGRDEKKAFSERKARELADIAAEVKANADKVGRPFPAGELHQIKGKMAGITVGAGRRLGAAVTRPETFLYWLDAETNGPLMKYILGEMQNGKYYKTDKVNEVGKAFREFVKEQPKGWQHSLDEEVNVPELLYSRGADGQPIQWLQRRGDVIMMATHFGSESNFTKLVEGFGWDAQTVRAVADRVLNDSDWKYVQHILDINKALLPEVQALYRATVGLALKELPATPIPTPFGTLPGGYRHISYDWNAIEEREGPDGEIINQEDPTSLHASDLFGSDYRVATPPNSYTLARTNFSAPLNLDHSILHLEIESVIHDLAYRRALIQATKIMRLPQVKQAVREALGPEYGETINNWLKDIARGSSFDQTVLKGGAALVRGLRRRFTIVQVGYNLATILKHGGIAAAHISGEVGAGEFAKASADLMKDKELQAWVDSTSGEVRGALMNLDRDVREVLQDLFRKQGFIENYQYHAFTAFGAVKRVEAMATWLAKYRILTEGGKTEEDAIALANKAVRDTQGAGAPVDLPALWRGNNDFWAELGKLMNVFTGFENTATNRMWTMIRRQQRIAGGGRNGPPPRGGVTGYADYGWAGARRDYQKQLSDLLSFFLYAALWATAFDTVTQGKLHKGVKNGAVFMETFLENTIKGALGGTGPWGSLLSEMPRAIATRGHDWGEGPIQQMFGEGIATAVNAYDATHHSAKHNPHHIEDRWVQHAIETAGYLAGIPVKPFAKGGQYAWDRAQGHVKDKGLIEFMRGSLFGPTSEQAKKRR